MRRLQPIYLCLITGLLFSVLLPAAFAQGRATVFGTVSDSSGAQIPGAEVVLTNVSTQQSASTKSGADGSYVLPNLNPGNYSLKATAEGFQTSVTSGIVLEVDENRKVSPRLVVGAVNTEVQVTESVAQVDTRSATLTEVVDSKRVKDLPLNGRNPLDLQQLVPGAGGTTNLNGQQQNAYVSINGNRYNENNYTLDGVDNEDPFFNSPSVVPNPDALDQFSIKTSNYGAQEGRGSGAQINALIKSGTNEYHGSVFEYLRNPVLDAKNYFGGAVAKSPYKRNQFGGSFGGPIWRNKLFFFGAFQRTVTHASPGVYTLIVPDAAEIAGNFAELCPAGFNASGICNSTAAPNKQLTIPGSKTPAKNNNLAAYVYQPTLKFLQAFVPAANGAGNTYTFTPPNAFTENQYIGRIDSTLSSRDTLSGHYIFVDNSNESTSTALNLPGFYASVAYKNYHVAVNEVHTFSPRLINVATFGFINISRVQEPHVPQQVTWGDFGAGVVRADPKAPVMYQTQVNTYFTAQSPAPLQQFRKEFQYSDGVTWTVHDHTLAMGGDFRVSNTQQSQSFQADPQLVFAATYTGNPLADFLVGRMNNIKQQSPNEGRPHSVQPAAYLQDDWKATSRLTLNLGLRWEPFLPYTDALGRLAQFRAGQQSTVFPAAPVGYVFPGDQGVPESTFPAHWKQFSPRIGVAYDVFGNGRTSLRAGIGMYYSSLRTQAFNSESLNQPYAIAINLPKPSGGMAAPYKDIGGSPYPFTPPSSSQYASYKFTTPLSTLNDFDPNFRASRTDQWNLSVQQQLPGGITAQVAYVGSAGEHLFFTVEQNPLHAGVRPYTNFSSIQRFSAGGHSTYHSLQTTLNKRLSQGITVLASYTYAKAIDNGTIENSQVTNPVCIPCNRGLGDLDIRNSFVMSSIWNLPNHKGGNVLFRGVTNGWQMSGIWQAQSGIPFSVLSGVDNSQSGIGQDLADVVAPVSLYPGHSRADQTTLGYLSQSSFAVNAVGTYGNSGRNSYIGPGADVVTLGMQKDIVRLEHVALRFRGELFNAFNHPVMSAPNNNVSSSTTFGKITSTGRDNRVGQVAMRVDF